MNYIAGLMSIFLLINSFRLYESYMAFNALDTRGILYFFVLLFFNIIFFGWTLEAIKDYYAIERL